jgi:transcriptional regulator with PAS, ATPase and Fis domain
MIRIQPFIQKIVEAMSTILDIEITVVDNTLNRIAGTGTFKSKIGEKIPESFVLANVIKSGKYHIIENPGEHSLCKNCLYHSHCNETAIIALPIVSKNVVIGGMCLVAFNKLQREKLLSKKEVLFSFIKNFSELISSKASEDELTESAQLMSEQLRNVIDAMNEGIIVVNKKGNISLVNAYVKQKINPRIGEIFLNKPLRKFMPEVPLDLTLNFGHHVNYQKGFIKNGRNIFQIIYSLIPVRVSSEVEGAILIFQLSEYAQKLAYKISEIRDSITFDEILGVNKSLREAKLKAEMAARSDSTILLLGESGTGKELFARAIHSASKRKGGPFVVINCAAIPDNLLESELFGYEKGAFTDARKEGKQGKFELTDKGTLLLDEIGDMNLGMQSKLLRFLEEKSFERVGGTTSLAVDVRIIASTSRNLDQMVEKGNFRLDLYYRISTIPIVLPPLRQRREDIPIYIDFFQRHFNIVLDKEIKGFTREALEVLKKYDWPGNVREIKNVVEYAMNMEDSPYICLKNLPERIVTGKSSMTNNLGSLDTQETELIINKLTKFGKTTIGKKSVAKEMGISLATLYRKLKKYHITTVTSA